MKNTSKKRKHNNPSSIEMTEKELLEVIKAVESSSLDKNSQEIVVNILLSYRWLNSQLEKGRLSIAKLKKLFFGSSSEKKDKLLKDQPKPKLKEGKEEDPSSGPSNSDLGKGGEDNSADTSESPESDKNSDEQAPKKPGHGKNGPSDYKLNNIIDVPHESLSTGDICPSCEASPLYLYGYGSVLRLMGQAPIVAELYRPEKLRCSGCGDLFTAKLPAEAGEQRIHPTANAMIALFNYGNGVPFYRMEGLQRQLKIPLPDATQFDMAEAVANAIHPIYKLFLKLAAQGEQISHDDTGVCILSLVKENKEGKNPKGRTGMQTTAIISKLSGKVIKLFISGRKHAGENLDDLLKNRPAGLGPPIQISDALSSNFTTEFKTILVNCFDHGRRNFVYIVSSFPEECRFIIDSLAKIYAFDKETKVQSMTDEERLSFHQKNSAPIMNELNSWMEEQFEKRLVEPNSNLGDAISYFLKHWNGLTEFLRTPGAPLSNIECEQLIKKCVLRRKNSMFYKTEIGALIGDVLMSIIQTASGIGINVFEYLVDLQIHAIKVRQCPENWLPWNYQKTIASI